MDWIIIAATPINGGVNEKKLRVALVSSPNGTELTEPSSLLDTLLTQISYEQNTFHKIPKFPVEDFVWSYERNRIGSYERNRIGSYGSRIAWSYEQFVSNSSPLEVDIGHSWIWICVFLNSCFPWNLTFGFKFSMVCKQNSTLVWFVPLVRCRGSFLTSDSEFNWKILLTCRFCEVAAKHAAKRALPPRRTIATD